MRSSGLGRLSLRQLERLAIAAPLLFLAIVYFFILGPVHAFFHSWGGFVVLLALFTPVVWMFSRSVFGAVRRLQHEVEELSEQTRQHNQQLVSLHSANIALLRQTNVDEAFERIVELSVDLLAACHALLVTRTGSHEDLVMHAAAGRSDPADCSLADIASKRGRGLDSIAPGERLLAAPVAHRGTLIGTLYLARRDGGPRFTAADDEIARMFATHAALVIQNDRLYEEVRTLAVEGERQALAREMHDSLAQVLSFVNTKAQAVEQYLRSEDVIAARQQMAELSAAAREVYSDIREGIAALRVDIAGKTLREVVTEYVHQFGESTGLDIELDWDVQDDELELPPTAEVQLLRIVQEALTNVRRHAAARAVTVSAARVDRQVDIVVADDGRGFEESSRLAADGRPRFGLQTMHERASAIGGRFSVESSPGQGTSVRVSVPVEVRSTVGRA